MKKEVGGGRGGDGGKFARMDGGGFGFCAGRDESRWDDTRSARRPREIFGSRIWRARAARERAAGSGPRAVELKRAAQTRGAGEVLRTALGALVESRARRVSAGSAGVMVQRLREGIACRSRTHFRRASLSLSLSRGRRVELVSWPTGALAGGRGRRGIEGSVETWDCGLGRVDGDVLAPEGGWRALQRGRGRKRIAAVGLGDVLAPIALRCAAESASKCRGGKATGEIREPRRALGACCGRGGAGSEEMR